MSKSLKNTDENYTAFLAEVKDQILCTRIRIVRSANSELIRLYWWLGKHIIDHQEKNKWGKSVVEQLSKDLQKTFSGRIGYSVQNLWYMRQFYLEYKDYLNLQQLVGEIPWGHNIIIMSKVKNIKARKYYSKVTM